MSHKLSLKTQTRTSLQQVVASRLLQATTVELTDLVIQELADNPALELVGELQRFPSDSSPAARNGSEEEAWEVAQPPKVLDHLLAQAALLVQEQDRALVTYLIHCLDDRGYLDRSCESLAAEVGASPEEMDRALAVLHQLDPPGLGARSLRECLVLQCAHLEAEDAGSPLARRILAQAWDDLTAGRWDQVAQDLGVTVDAVRNAACFISGNLYPYPLALLSGQAVHPAEAAAAMIPDLVIRRDGDHLRVEVPTAAEFALRVSPSFRQALTAADVDLPAAERDWIGQEIGRARLFIAALRQRWATLRRFGEFLVEYQGDYLRHGPLDLRPMTQATVSDQLGLHPSTISRLVRDKVMQLPDGRLAPLAECFDSALPAREAIKRLLAEAEHPLSDREISERLESQGLCLARRTVAKYRQQLHLPSSQGLVPFVQRSKVDPSRTAA